jgi:hypothetical protein
MTDGPNGQRGDVERYEQLRRQALSGERSGWRLGLALLERRGVAVWARAWQGTAAAPAPPAASAPTVQLPPAGDELVGALASMALASVAGG